MIPGRWRVREIAMIDWREKAALLRFWERLDRTKVIVTKTLFFNPF
jgi:hypothetical protein